ncbi:MAG: glycoside hydrolase family 32 protein [Balneolaceae bacterium]
MTYSKIKKISIHILFSGLYISLLSLSACKGDGPTNGQEEPPVVEEVLEEMDNYRPFYHLTTPFGWQSDPTGMFYYDNRFHISYIHNPDAPNHGGNQHWRKAASTDLMSWVDQGVILEPDDLGRISSGSAVVDKDNTSGFKSNDNEGDVAVIMFTSNGGSIQQQSLAYSNDKGDTWTKYSGNPVLSLGRTGAFRDPKLMWHEERQKWIQVVAAGDRIKIYSSDNLIDWDFESDFGPNVVHANGVWECPDLFYIKTEEGEGKWVMIVSHGGGINDGPNGGSSTQYYIGDFDGHSFTPEHQDILWLDFGIDNYAGVTWSDVPEEDGRRIHIGWMGNWYYASSIPDNGWRGTMTFPREVTLQKSSNRYFLAFNPVRELEDQLGSQETYNEAQSSIQLKDNAIIKTGSYRVKTELNLSQVSNMSLTLGNKSERLTLYYDKGNEEFTLRRSASGLTDFNELFGQDIEAGFSVTGETLPLEILVDQTSIEVFINSGEKVMTATFFPRYNYSNLEIKSSGGSENSGLVQSVQLDEIKKTVNHTY